MLKIKNAQFIKSIMEWRDAPTMKLPEIAFVGRSNVGKSSMINRLVNIHNFARVSKQPGKTRSINYFNIDDRFYLVDLPGYGFARVSKKEKALWRKAVEGYLLNSGHLQRLFILVDGKVGAKENDLQLIEWIKYQQIPYTLIITKIDKIAKSSRRQQLEKIYKQVCSTDNEMVIIFSAKDGTGREALLQCLTRTLERK